VLTHEIEYWALEVIRRVEAGQPNEDSRVELKAKWPDDLKKAARQLAGHANAARGGPVLWLVGVDQKAGVTGANHVELANWFPGIQANFEGLTPRLTDVNLPRSDGKSVVALFFETDRLPFVVKNPVAGQPQAGPVTLEVPWREGTKTRSARRDELVLLLVPRIKLPECEILAATLTPQNANTSSGLRWWLRAKLYVAPAMPETIAIPFHRCTGSFRFGTGDRIHFSRILLSPPSSLTPDQRVLSETICRTGDELFVSGPGVVFLDANAYEGQAPEYPEADAEVSVKLGPVGTGIPIGIDLRLTYNPRSDGSLCWDFKKSDAGFENNESEEGNSSNNP
jgi:hypothetical protein